MSTYDVGQPQMIAPVSTPEAAPMPVPISVPAAAPVVALPGSGGGESFASQAGPDVSYGVTQSYAQFNVDPATKRVQINVVDQAGRVLRMIPPGSVAEMLREMSAY